MSLFHHFQEVRFSVSFNCRSGNQDTNEYFLEQDVIEGKDFTVGFVYKADGFFYRLCAVKSCLKSDEQNLRMVQVQNLMSQSFSKSLSPPNRN